MKSRRIVIIALVLAASLTIGVGYAALTDALTVSGTGVISQTAANEQFDGEVYFTNVENPVNCTAELPEGEKPDTATITIKDTLT